VSAPTANPAPAAISKIKIHTITRFMKRGYPKRFV